jgi:Ca2+-transporting ATPase
MEPQFNVSSAAGLSTAQVEQRLKNEGYNELPASGRRTTFQIALGAVREPMFLLLIASVVIYLTVGDMREALLLFRPAA